MADEGGCGEVERVEGKLSNYVKADAGKDAATMAPRVSAPATTWLPRCHTWLWVMRMILNSLESLQLITNLTENSFLSQRGGAHYALTDLGTALLAKLRNEDETLQSTALA
ncbi:hypothetical protein [Amycolatopsis sp. NPDC051372]|uniref:hypothetical protein n=1 Tax=unclassified Amycolatopsis TaxID=2618356 RepID=UPI00341722F9